MVYLFIFGVLSAIPALNQMSSKSANLASLVSAGTFAKSTAHLFETA